MELKLDPSIIKQGYYYKVIIQWENAARKWEKEYGNLFSAMKAAKDFNKFKDCKAEVEKIDL